MQIYLNFFGLDVPSYGFLIALGVIIANLVARVTIKKWQLVWEDLIILEGYSALGMLMGSKLLYIIVSLRQFSLNQLLDLHYLNAIMSSGFVFYGGLIGMVIAVFLVQKIHGIDIINYLIHLVYMIPLVHAFGRMGCFMAGCCYGIPYRGIFKVRFPVGAFAPAGIDLFPVQLVEALGLLAIAISLFLLDYVFHKKYTVIVYLMSYSALRFVLEFYRYDAIRGLWGGLSTSQWISIIVFLCSVLIILRCRK